jgi:hypothetical protein
MSNNHDPVSPAWTRSIDEVPIEEAQYKDLIEVAINDALRDGYELVDWVTTKTPVRRILRAHGRRLSADNKTYFAEFIFWEESSKICSLINVGLYRPFQ